MSEGLTVLIVGFATVFAGLLCIIILIRLLSLVVGAFSKSKEGTVAKQGSGQPTFTPEPAVKAPASYSGYTGNRQEFVAAVSAAIATKMGVDVQGLRIKSIRRVGKTPAARDESRQALVAAISAAIATQMGTSVDRLRIHSIKKLSA